MKIFPQNAALRRHINRQHQSEPKKCDFCNLKSKRLDHLNAHMRICKNNPTVEDRSENKNNSTMAKKNEIIQTTESEPLVKRKANKNDDFEEDIEQTEAEKCQLCSKHFQTAFQLQKHLVDIHRIKGKFLNQLSTKKHLQDGNIFDHFFINKY